MDSIIEFFSIIFKLACLILLVLVLIAFFGYNKLRGLTEEIKEAWSNLGVVGRKQASLINQLIEVVKGYQESEKLIVLKISDDMTNTRGMAQMVQKSGMVLSSINGIAERYPELKTDHQYQRLIDSIQSCETQLEQTRSAYNKVVRRYNTERSSIPGIFYAPILGSVDV